MDANLSTEFEAYANSFGRGYLKFYKAVGILSTLSRIPSIMDDEVRFGDFLHNSLDMEGFAAADVELIQGWLYERKDAIV